MDFFRVNRFILVSLGRRPVRTAPMWSPASPQERCESGGAAAQSVGAGLSAERFGGTLLKDADPH